MVTAGELDELMNLSWRARSEVAVGGWFVRRSGGVTQRANSVLPVAAPPDVLDAVVRVEELYEEDGLPPCFQISSAARPLELDQVLATRGYEPGGATKVQVAAIDDVLRRSPPSGAHVEIRDEPDEDWLDLWWSVDGRGGPDARAVAAGILTAAPALYASSRDEAGVTAVGRLSLMGRWGGVYCMAVRPDARRRGRAVEILRALSEHSVQLGVRHAWLQVVADNAAARSLYRKVGFEEFSGYHYRTLRSTPKVEPPNDSRSIS